MTDRPQPGPVSTGPWAGWLCYADAEEDTFLGLVGPSYTRWESGNRATVAVETRAIHRNRNGRLHGGFIAAVADHVGFAALNAMGRPEQMRGATVDLQVQFIGAGHVGPPLMAEVEILKETGRLFFARMTFAQEGETVAAATAVFRKAREIS